MTTEKAASYAAQAIAGEIETAEWYNGTWHTVTPEVSTNGNIVKCVIVIDFGAAAGNDITAVRVKDDDGNVLCSRDVTISVSEDDGIMYVLRITANSEEA